MGKANRIKADKAANALAAPVKKRNQKKNMPTWVGTALVIGVLVLVSLFAVFSVLRTRGTFMRMCTIAETENFEITVPMMSYMVYTEYQTMVQTYEQYSEQFGTKISIPAADSTGTSLDTSKALRDQIYQVKTESDGSKTTTTWFDYFANKAKTDIEQILACCEYAYRNNIELSESELDAIDITLSNMTLYAQYYGYTPNGYLASMYGKGVIEKDVREMMILSELANKASSQRSEAILNGIEDADVQKEYDTNKSKYDTFIDYIGYTFSVSFKPTDASAEGAAEKNAEKKAEYEAKQAKYAQYITELYAAETSKEFSEKLLTILQAMYLEEERETLLSKKTGDNPQLTEEEEKTCSNNASTRAIAAVEKAEKKNANADNVSDTVLKDWLKSTDPARKENDKLKDEVVYDAFGNKLVNGEIEGEADTAKTTYAEATSTYSVYFTNSALHQDTGVVRSVGHILFSADTYKDLTSTSKLSGVVKTLADRVLARVGKVTAKEMAVEMVTLMKEEGKITEKTVDGKTVYIMDEKVFESYGKAYTEDGSVFYDDVTEGQMVAEFEDWLFDAARVEGEISYPGGVETDYGYHVMIYRGGEKPSWSHTIRNNLAEGQYDEWLKGEKAASPVSFGKASLWNMITG